MNYYNFNSKIIKEINKTNNKSLIILDNTKSIKLNMLKQIKNNNCYFKIYGGLKYIEFLPRYEKRILYSLNEMKKIISEFENIEKSLPNKKIDKIFCIYDYIRRNIKYYPNEKNDKKIRSLMVIVNKKAVCSGYSLVLKELLDRNNIKNKYIKYYNHIWNHICINKKYYDVDVTWDSCVYHKCSSSNLHFISNNISLSKRHHFYKTNKNILKNNVLNEYIINKIELVRESGTKFYITLLPIGIDKKYYLYEEDNKRFLISSLDDFELILSEQNREIISCYINCFFTRERIEKYLVDDVSYLGYALVKDGYFYRKGSIKKDKYIKKVITKNNKTIINTLDDSYMIDELYNMRRI